MMMVSDGLANRVVEWCRPPPGDDVMVYWDRLGIHDGQNKRFGVVFDRFPSVPGKEALVNWALTMVGKTHALMQNYMETNDGINDCDPSTNGRKYGAED
jgi:hypothetical protein